MLMLEESEIWLSNHSKQINKAKLSYVKVWELN